MLSSGKIREHLKMTDGAVVKKSIILENNTYQNKSHYGVGDRYRNHMEIVPEDERVETKINNSRIP